MGEPEVVLERSGWIARVILNRPERRNALGARTLPALNGVLDAIEADRDIDVVILTGRGPVFCGGGDLEEIMSPERTDREWISSTRRTCRALPSGVTITSAAWRLIAGSGERSRSDVDMRVNGS